MLLSAPYIPVLALALALAADLLLALAAEEDAVAADTTGAVVTDDAFLGSLGAEYFNESREPPAESPPLPPPSPPLPLPPPPNKPRREDIGS